MTTDRDSGVRETSTLPGDDALTADEQALRAELIDAGKRLDRPAPDLAGRLLDALAPKLEHELRPPWFARRRTWMATFVGLAAAAALVLSLGRRQRESAFLVQPEPPHRSGTVSRAQPADPCLQRFHATGTSPLIDDFEDGDAASIPVEGRGDRWILILDTDPEGTARAVAPELRPDGSTTNRRALHLVGPELRSWGAQAMLSFRPHVCYDVSVYAGITFRAKGPGRLFVGAEGVRQTPRKWGGTCEKDCYNDHVARVNLGRQWQTVELRWADLRQRGYEGEPLDVTSVDMLVFLVRAEDTPFDVWIDDLAFLTSEHGRNPKP